MVADIHSATEVNCVYVAHRLIHTLSGVLLPADMDPVHMILDNPYLRPLKDEPMVLGDILFVGPSGIAEFQPIPDEIKHDTQKAHAFKKNFPGPHLAVCLGALGGDTYFIHANYVDRQVSIWPLQRFLEHPRYCVVYGRKRPIST